MLKKNLTILMICMITSTTTLSQVKQTKSEGTKFNRQETVVIHEALVVCEFAIKKVEIYANTIGAKDVMINDLRDQVQRSILEIQKRDDLNDRNKLALDLASETINDLSKALDKERKRKKMNKWIYFGAGVVGGVVGYKQLNK